MIVKRVKIDPILFEILSDKTKQRFNVIEVRDLFLSLFPERVNSSAARQKVYLLFRKLTTLGVLERHSALNARRTTYSKTQLFSQVKYTGGKTFVFESKQNQTDKVELDTSTSKLKLLHERLKDYRDQLESSIAESEEYRSLYKVCPDLKGFLENKYLEARARSSKCLGQVNAVKSVLAQFRAD